MEDGNDDRSKGMKDMIAVMRKWVTVGILSLQASLSQAADLPEAVTHADFPEFPFSTVLLGRDLFYDPILSGNRDIACASCHHPVFGSGDQVALGLGPGGHGPGRARIAPPSRRHVPRHAPALFNLGAPEFTALFHDGRLARDSTARMGHRMPAGHALERPVPLTLAAQALLPMVAPREMAGEPGENEVADAVARGEIRGLRGAWQFLAKRVEAIPEYRHRFDSIIGPNEPVHITDISTAIAAFVSYEFRSTDSPFDAWLAGRKNALTPPQKRGAALFYGKARCSVCHSGTFQTDHAFHAIGMPQIGPGKDHGAPGADHGRAAVTGDPGDLYRFRTPSLRNVTLTAPYGHTGAYATLDGVIRHHLDPATALDRFDPTQVPLPALDGPGTSPATGPGAEEIARIRSAIEIDLPPLTDAEISELIAFLDSLTDANAVIGRLGAPGRVPSGLPLDPLPLN